MTRLLRIAAAALFFLPAGCVNLTLTHACQGEPVRAAALSSLEPGKTSLDELLVRLGAPREAHVHPDGRLLVWRRRVRNTSEFGFDAGAATRLIDVTQITSSLLGLFRFTLDRAHTDEERLVVLVNRNGVLVGFGYRDGTANLPQF